VNSDWIFSSLKRFNSMERFQLSLSTTGNHMHKFKSAALLIMLFGWFGGVPGGPVQAATNEHRPVCSPDGSRVVYMLQSERTKNDWELYQMVFSTQTKKRLTVHEGWDGYAVWSPGGDRIIFDREDEPGGQKRPWVMRMDDFTIKPLGEFEGWLSVNDWSVEGSLLAFHEVEGQRDLVLVDLDGNILENVTETKDHSEHDAHFSPDGTKIAYANGPVDGGETSLELIERETGKKTILHTSIGRVYGISWSPDGAGIAFVDTPGGDDDDADIFLYDIDEKSVRQISDNPAWDHMPEFCHNKHSLLFTSYRSGEERIYQVDPDPAPFLSVERAQQ
jgi:Tol biopolymer transport system component